jgi:hypothetical protein
MELVEMMGLAPRVDAYPVHGVIKERSIGQQELEDFLFLLAQHSICMWAKPPDCLWKG